MADFTLVKLKKNKRDLSSLISVKFVGKIDQKGRITIPSDVRRSFGIYDDDAFCIFQNFNSTVKAVIVFKKLSDSKGGLYD